ncbi:urease accessory protein UreD [Aquibium oceanicum]|uniref:Urease accessory protein UreD n=1 Tax=Aquibium oceanicum TaxID=1670800 RepID=A0A1L3SNQ8_9HYPH|nr:urease accessory protein [Aquibium oceanicum]
MTELTKILPQRQQRVDARAALSVWQRMERSRIERLFQEGAAKIRLPRVSGDPLEAVLINTAGGLTGGDRIAWSVDVGDGTSAVVTTQACERIYRSSGGTAQATVSLKAGADARLAWLPQETILFDGSAFSRTISADLEPGASALFVEAVLFGRLRMGEVLRRGLYRDRWRIRRGGKLVHAEEFAIGPEVADALEMAAVTGGRKAIATVLYIGDDADGFLAQARDVIGEDGGASVWSIGDSGKLLARLAARDGYDLRKRLVPLIGLLNGKAGLPKTWSI